MCVGMYVYLSIYALCMYMHVCVCRYVYLSISVYALCIFDEVN